MDRAPARLGRRGPTLRKHVTGWAHWRAGLAERWSPAWPTRPRTVWSDHGGRRRQVTVVWRRDERWLIGRCALTFFLGLAYVIGLAVLVSSIAVLLAWWTFDDPPGPPFEGPVGRIVLVVATVMGVLTVIGLHVEQAVHRRRDRRRRRALFEGAVVFREIVGSYDYEGDPIGVPYLAVDDGTSDTVTAFPVQDEIHGGVMVGDIVRVLPEDDTGTRPVELLDDTHRRPPLPDATMPETPPGAPVAVDDVVFAARTGVRGVEVTTTDIGDQTIQTWTYHLDRTGDPHIQVHVTPGGQPGAAALIALVRPRHRPPQHDSIGYHVERYEAPVLLIARQGTATIGVQTSALDTTGYYPWWDKLIARKALGRLTTPPSP
jgi:hypothetical protein